MTNTPVPPNDCRTAFEQWSKEQGWDISGPEARMRWAAWQGARNTQTQPSPESSLTESLDRIQAALEHYQYVDDGVVTFVKGFAAKKGDIDQNSIARAALADLAIVRQHQVTLPTQPSGHSVDSPLSLSDSPKPLLSDDQNKESEIRDDRALSLIGIFSKRKRN